MAAILINSNDSLQRAFGSGEIWMDIPGLEGRYQASTHGRIRSLDREGKTCYGATRKLKGRLLRMTGGKRGYLRIPPNICETQFVHRLVAMTFIPNPGRLPVINHIDGNKQNNRVENLEWCTQLENMQHAFRTGLAAGMDLKKGEDSIAAKLTESQVIEIKRRIKEGERLIDISIDYPVSKSAIAEIKAGRSWGHVKCN